MHSGRFLSDLGTSIYEVRTKPSAESRAVVTLEPSPPASSQSSRRDMLDRSNNDSKVITIRGGGCLLAMTLLQLAVAGSIGSIFLPATANILVFGGLLNEPAFKGRSTEPLVHTGGGQGRWGVQLTKKFVDVINVSSRFRN